jgi:cytochrome c556
MCLVGCLVLAAVGARATVQDDEKPYPIFTVDHFVATMKTVGPNFVAASELLQDADHDAAKAQFIRAREQLATTITFWRKHDRTDAVGFLRDTLNRLDEIDDALSAQPVKPGPLAGLVSQAGAACEACHAVYRERNATTGEYRVKAEMLEMP